MRPERVRALSCHGTRIVVELANDTLTPTRPLFRRQ